MSTGSSRNQTLSFLKRRFREAGIEPQKRLGQNFLVDMNLQRLLLDSAELGPDDVVLEIGTGTGSLSVLMAERAAAVVTVELDPALFQLAGEELYDRANVTMLHADVLKNKNRLNPDVMAVVESKVAEQTGRRLKLVSNLPYNVATPIVSNLLATEMPPETMVITIQKELADRLIAQPGTKDYGALSIWVQSQCRSEIVRVMPPTVFWPRPKVSSAIVRIELDHKLRSRISDRAFFHTFVRSMFFHRRKYLRSELISACKGRFTKPQVDAVLGQLRLDGTMRAEQLDVPAMLRLCEAVRLGPPD